jgi:hypothetical protein
LEFAKKWTEPTWHAAHEFRSRGRTVVIAWTREEDAPPLHLPEGRQALDPMGNPLLGQDISIGETPVYIVGD